MSLAHGLQSGGLHGDLADHDLFPSLLQKWGFGLPLGT
ncbi:hypothetical protein RGUI_2419 [Rhodovulum sp. P5]|nr:hypothetical protein RGUI_2419 [Rhodovulum sp. P5]